MFAKIFQAVFGAGLDPILDKLLPDLDARKEMKYEIVRLVEEGAQAVEAAEASDRRAQADINLQEAAHRNLFVSGWRPAVGWVCVFGIFWVFIGHPVASWGISLWGWEANVPAIPEERIMELLIALLGMGTLRTAEKLRGVARKR